MIKFRFDHFEQFRRSKPRYCEWEKSSDDQCKTVPETATGPQG